MTTPTDDSHQPDDDPALILQRRAVDALADQLHDMSCTPTIGLDLTRADPRHRQVDLGKARFLLLGLRATGWHLHNPKVIM